MSEKRPKARTPTAHYHSVDSAPRRFSRNVAWWRAPAVLLTFCLIAYGLLWTVNASSLSFLFQNHDLALSQYTGTHAIAVRVFILSFYISFSIFASAGWRGRLLFGVDLFLTYTAFCMILDFLNLILGWTMSVHLSWHFSAIVSGLVGFGLFAMKLLERGEMPARIKVESKGPAIARPFLRLVIALATATAMSVWIAQQSFAAVEWMRNLAFLGGIGPGVFLILPLFFAQLFLLANVQRFFTKRDPDTKAAVSVIIPAHNEEHIIGKTIRSIEVAAKHYGGRVDILVLDNNSTDATADIAARELATCKYATGHVVPVPTPGKSHALNTGLRSANSDLLLRVDADTQLGEDNLTRAVSYFSDPRVGLVGGMPLPPGGGPFDSARLLEVLVKHGFYSVALGAINGIVGIPGMFVMYRTNLPKELGGFVEGMNGEDTDISLRIGELGYRAIVDSRIRYVSEVPTSYEHMREQRTRWFRSVFHVSARCRDLIYGTRPSIRGRIMLPYMLINSARRTMLVPLILFGIIEYGSGLNPQSGLVWQAIAAVAIGAPAIMAVVACIVTGKPSAIAAIPNYLGFRVLRAYFTLESMLTISVRRKWKNFSAPTLNDVRESKPVRVA
ncbi:glycosyltransferase [Thalassospira alkalitolerans]|uniref:glycosyltransferase n=1 Tax=Thalassospira alkalitolerans TaxID=1293890 RepID=UPI003AA920EC